MKYRRIPLTQGQHAIVSEADYEELCGFSWHALWYPHTRSYYAVRSEGPQGARTISMHRQLLGLASGDKRMGDHVSGNTLDNRRENLRIATASQNCQNSRMRSHNTSGFKGAFWHKRMQKWQAAIRVNRKLLHLGYHETAEEAHRAYKLAATQHHGEFARAA